jgi:hypothetical protein
MPVIPELGRQRQEDRKFETGRVYVAELLSQQTNNNNKQIKKAY